MRMGCRATLPGRGLCPIAPLPTGSTKDNVFACLRLRIIDRKGALTEMARSENVRVCRGDSARKKHRDTRRSIPLVHKQPLPSLRTFPTVLRRPSGSKHGRYHGHPAGAGRGTRSTGCGVGNPTVSITCLRRRSEVHWCQDVAVGQSVGIPPREVQHGDGHGDVLLFRFTIERSGRARQFRHTVEGFV